MFKLIKTFTRACLWLIMMFSVFMIILNLVVASYPSKSLKKILNSDNLSIGKVNTLFLPFFGDISDFRYSDDFFELKIDSLRFETVWRNIFRKEGFINFEVAGGYLRVNKNSVEPGEENGSYSSINLLNMLAVKDFDLSYCKIDKCFYGRLSKVFVDMGSSFFVEIYNGGVKSDDIELRFKASASGRLGETLAIEHANINGESWYINVENGEAQKNRITGNVSFFLSENFIQVWDKNFTGSVKGGGKFNNLDFKVTLVAEEVKYKNHQIFARVNVEKKQSRIIFSGNGLRFDNVTFDSNGEYDIVSKNVGVDINFADFLVYEFDYEQLKVNDLFFGGNIRDNQYNLLLKGDFYGGYTVRMGLSYLGNGFSFEQIEGTGSFGRITGDGNFVDGGFDGEFRLQLVDAKFIQKFLKDSHAFDISTSFSYFDGRINFDGSFRSLKPTSYRGVKLGEVEGCFSVNNENLMLVFSLISGNRVVRGKVISNGYRDFKNISLAGSYNFLGTDINQALKLKEDFLDERAVSGVFNFDRLFPEPEGSLNFFIPTDNISGKLAISGMKIFFEDISAFGNIFKSPGYLDLKEQILKLSVNNGRYEDKDIYLRDISLDITGHFKDPEIEGSFVMGFYKLKEKRRFYVSGKSGNVKISLYDNDLKIFADLGLYEKTLKTHLLLNNYVLNDNITVSGDAIGLTRDFKKILVTGLMDILYEGDVYTLSDVYGEVLIKDEGVSLSNGSVLLFTPVADYIKLDGISFEDNLVKGAIYTDNIVLDNPFLWNLNLAGVLNFTYKIGGKAPLLSGELLLSGDIKDPNSINRLRNVDSLLLFEGEKLSCDFRSDYLDTKIIGSVSAVNYTLPETFLGNFTFKNLFLSLANFTGTVSGSLNFQGKDIVSEIGIVKGFYEFKPSRGNPESRDIPFTLDLKIKTLEPIVISGFGVTSNAVVDLRLRYQKELLITGMVRSINTSFDVANSKFNLVQGVLKFSEDNTPYLYMNARGTGSLKNIVLNVEGFLPEYNIEVRDLSPTGVGIGNTNQPGGDSSALVSSIFNGQVFSQIVSLTNKLFGINELGVKGNAEQGGDLFLGRQFSDRFGVRYILKSDAKLNELVGEYTIFDWLNLNIFSSGDRKTGAGVSFYFSF